MNPRPMCIGMVQASVLALAILTLIFVPLAQAETPFPTFAPEGSGGNYLDVTNGTTTELPSIEALYLDRLPVSLDGRLDDEAWAMAQTGWGFQQIEPERGADPSVPTTFKVLYDDEAIYFGVACYEDDMAKISSFLSRRDQIEASDLVSIYIDPYHDRSTGYNFRVNPAGVMEDVYLFDNGNRDRDWDAVWEAEVFSDDKGWYVEVRVPFSAIRFKPGEDMTWGLQVYRWLHGRGEDTGWVLWDRNVSGFVSRWGLLTGLKGVANPRKLEVRPYFVTKHTDPAADCPDDNWENSQSLGADLKYGLTSNLTLNATFQPDFGQVEADPSVLNLSPFETFFGEKRPFFVEGARFFQHPSFNLFYSRRIGTGDPNSRIRGAAKLTGKIGGDFSVAFLGAATDIGVPGKTHNPFVGGDQKTYYGLARMGKEFNEGNHQINFMGTAVKRNRDSFVGVDNDRFLRDGYSGGMDFQLNFDDRNYRVSGSAVGTIVDSFRDHFDPTLPNGKKYGTAGNLYLGKTGGDWQIDLQSTWESDELDPNDMGFLQAPDEKTVFGELEYNWNSSGQGEAFNQLEIELSAYRNWLYSGNNSLDPDSGDEIWSYGPGHHQSTGFQLLTWAQHRTFNQGWVFVGTNLDGTDKYVTRRANVDDPHDRKSPRGPLMTQPGWTNIACGGTTDWRKPVSLHLEFHGDFGGNLTALATEGNLRWNQNEHFSHWIGWGIRHNQVDAQWVGNYANDGSMPGVTGIGGIDYVFANLDQYIWDLTLRSSVLFDRDRSLQLYVQPFLTRGRYANATWLAGADSYDLRPYDLDASQNDFYFGAVNLNLVYRWEYRPGSTLFVVWTHNKDRYQERSEFSAQEQWSNDFDAGFPFAAEPGNTFLVKMNYWFSI